MNMKTIYRIADGVRSREEDFGLLVVSKTTPALALNEDMKIVWNLIDGKSTVEQILFSIQKLYPKFEVEKKVVDIFNTLIKVGLICIIDEDPNI